MYDAAGSVSHEEPGKRGHDAVGTGLATLHRPIDHRHALKASINLFDKLERLGVDDIDDRIGTIGEIVGLGQLVDETDIKGVQLTIRCVRRGPGDRHRLK